MVVRISMAGRRYDEADRLPRELELPEGATTEDALAALRKTAEELIHESMLILVDGKHLGTVGRHRAAPLRENAELELLAPVAGG